MTLRTKCALLLLAFELTLGVTIFLTVRYIEAYFEDAAGVLTQSSAGIADTNRLRMLVREELTLIMQAEPHRPIQQDLQRIHRQIDVIAASLKKNLADHPNNLHLERFSNLIAARDRAVGSVSEDGAPEEMAATSFDSQADWQLDHFLDNLESALLDDVRKSVDASFSAQHTAALILSINMLVGAGLGFMGMVLVHRWVLLPVQELKRTTDELGKGNLDYRAKVSSRDELGQLAGAVNKMSSDLSRIERLLIRRERMAAMGELISYVTHNIRNPLAGIRSSAEACRRQLDDASPLNELHDQIVTSIDKFQKWLRELEQTCSPLEIHARSVALTQMVGNVVAVFRPMSDRRSIAVITRIPEDRDRVLVDARHFEQALAAVVGNAVEAAGDGGRIVIETESNGDDSQWHLVVSDTGPGIAPDVRSRIFEPSFTTKQNGHGLGLSLARKIVELHGGQLIVDCPPEGGTHFTFAMPVEPATGLHYG